MKILIVEDEHFLEDIFKKFFEILKYNATCVNSGLKAIEICRKEPYDIAFIDYNLPVMNGRVTADRLKILVPDIKIIITTGYIGNVDLKNGERLLPKPFTINNLEELLKEVISEKS